MPATPVPTTPNTKIISRSSRRSNNKKREAELPVFAYSALFITWVRLTATDDYLAGVGRDNIAVIDVVCRKIDLIAHAVIKLYQIGLGIFRRVGTHPGIAKRRLLRCRCADVDILHHTAPKRRYHNYAKSKHDDDRYRECDELNAADTAALLSVP